MIALPQHCWRASCWHPARRCRNQDIVPQWVTLAWPKDDGCKAAAVSQTLVPGTLIDRFGDESGSYFSPKGESFGKRALPYVCSQTAYTVYRVIRPLHVSSCEAVAWFGEPGGATQYKTDEPVSRLRKEGEIQTVADNVPPPCDN
jgi:Tuberculosis necrotizing toxin